MGEKSFALKFSHQQHVVLKLAGGDSTENLQKPVLDRGGSIVKGIDINCVYKRKQNNGIQINHQVSVALRATANSMLRLESVASQRRLDSFATDLLGAFAGAPQIPRWVEDQLVVVRLTIEHLQTLIPLETGKAIWEFAGEVCCIYRASCVLVFSIKLFIPATG